jgi:N utilization substance protein B
VGSRRDARRVAIDILYQADLTDREPSDVLRDWRDAGRDVPVFSRELVEGVAQRMPTIDLELEEHSEDWPVARMPVLDRTILRVGLFEVRWREDVPTSVAISEAVETANELSTEDSGRFVNGVLGKIAREAERT